MEEKPLGQAQVLFMPNGEQIPFGEIDDHITQFPKLEPGGWVNDSPFPKFSGEVVIKTKKTPLFRQFQKLLYGRRKLPRKLKKAFKHIQLVTPIEIVEETKEHKFQIIATEYYKTRNGYPYTKWVRKAIRIATKERQEMIGSIMVSLEEHFEQIRKGETL